MPVWTTFQSWKLPKKICKMAVLNEKRRKIIYINFIIKYIYYRCQEIMQTTVNI